MPRKWLPGQREAAATGALIKLALVVEDVFGDTAPDLVPVHHGQGFVAAAAAAQGLEPTPGNLEEGEDFLQLLLGAGRGQDQDVGPARLFQRLLPRQDEGVGLRRRQGTGGCGGEAAHLRVEPAEPQPFGQAAQRQVNQEFHGIHMPEVRGQEKVRLRFTPTLILPSPGRRKESTYLVSDLDAGPG